MSFRSGRYHPALTNCSYNNPCNHVCCGVSFTNCPLTANFPTPSQPGLFLPCALQIGAPTSADEDRRNQPLCNRAFKSAQVNAHFLILMPPRRKSTRRAKKDPEAQEDQREPSPKVWPAAHLICTGSWTTVLIETWGATTGGSTGAPASSDSRLDEAGRAETKGSTHHVHFSPKASRVFAEASSTTTPRREFIAGKTRY